MNSILRIYKFFVSPVLAGLGCSCRFHPTCSEYVANVFARFPFWQAVLLSGKRLLKCGPWHEGGIDKSEQ